MSERTAPTNWSDDERRLFGALEQELVADQQIGAMLDELGRDGTAGSAQQPRRASAAVPLMITMLAIVATIGLLSVSPFASFVCFVIALAAAGRASRATLDGRGNDLAARAVDQMTRLRARRPQR